MQADSTYVLLPELQCYGCTNYKEKVKAHIRDNEAECGVK
jgi:hypothetical protein